MAGHPFDLLGLRPVINADARLTTLGGSRMPVPVRRAMVEAATRYVDMHALQAAAGRRIAELTGNEAAFITAGAAAGLVVSTLACRTRGDLSRIARLLEGPLGDDGAGPDEILMHRGHRIPYDPALRLAGAHVVEFGNALQTFEWELEAALCDRTAAVLYVAGSHLAGPVLPLADVVRIAHERGVPVIVDAAAQTPPVDNLWRFTVELGADLAVFSGGKDLEGPQASGLVVGSSALVEAMRANAAPHQRLARAMKVGKEEIAGLVVAVERYLSLDHRARIAGWEAVIARIVADLDVLEGVTARRSYPNEAGQPHPRAWVEIDPNVTGWTAPALALALWEGDPRIAVAVEHEAAVSMSADPLDDGEDAPVRARVRELLRTPPA